jgi:hypothetical protein
MCRDVVILENWGKNWLPTALCDGKLSILFLVSFVVDFFYHKGYKGNTKFTKKMFVI